MSQNKILSDKAVAYFHKGHNCAQSVLLSMFERCRENKSDLIPKIASGFGGGIGRCGSVCGALAGGVMTLGMKFGTNKPSAKKREKVYALAQELYKRFEKQHGSVLCRDLIGYDLSNAEELEKARKTKVFEQKCPVLIRKTIETILEFEDSH